MNLRTKTFLYIAAVFVISFAAMAIVFSKFILEGYNREEELNVTEKVEQVTTALKADFDSLDSLVTDWAEWNDTYQFVQDQNVAYVESNLIDSTFFNNRMNLAAYLDSRGKVVYIKAYSLVDGVEIPVPKPLETYIQPDSPLLARSETDAGQQEIISLPYAPMMVVSHPILTSDGGGPFRGTLIFGRYLDSVEIGHLISSNRLTLHGYLPDGTETPEDVREALSRLVQGTPTVITPLNEKTIAGYTLVRDFNSKPALVLRIDSPRIFYDQSRKDISYFAGGFIGFGVLIILVILYQLERVVISPISKLSAKVSLIGQKRDLSARVSIPGKDEVSHLAANINGMLENIEQARKLQKESETFNYALLQDSPNPIEVMNRDGSLRYVNPALEKITGYSQIQLIGRKPPFPWWPINLAESYTASLIETIAKQETSKDVQKLERQFQQLSGEPFWVEVTSTAIVEDHQLKFFVANWVDITERKKADEIVRESEKRFRELAELLPELAFETDLQGKLTFVNRVAFRIFGYSPEDYGHLNLFDLIAPEIRKTAKLNVEKIIAGEDLPNFEYVAIRKNGVCFPAYIHAAAIKDHQEQVIGLRGILVDITSQKEIEAELRASEQFSSSLLDNAPNPLLVTNPDSSLRYVNPAFERLFGYTREEVIGLKPPFPWWPPEQIEPYKVSIGLLDSGQLTNDERYYQTKDGKIIWVVLTLKPILENGEIQYRLANMVDITEGKRAEAALRESEEFSTSLRDHSPFPIMVINPDASIRYVNPALEKLSGYSAVELLGHKSPYPFLPGNLTQPQMSALSTNLMSSRQLEALFQKKSGEYFYVNVTSANILEDNRLKYTLSIWVDITAQKLASEELEKLYQREKNLREALQTEIKNRTEFTRALVHELKTPLTPIMASSELLVEELTEEPLRSLAKNVFQGAENMNRRVDELLDLARGEVGLLKVNLRPVDAGKLLKEVFVYMEPAARNKGQNLLIDLPDTLPVIMADDDRLRQILFNLINNSMKYSPAGAQIKITAREEGASLITAIQDTGRGMSEQEQEKLFQPYYRIEGREHMSGLGIGLALSKRLVELQRGQIWVNSRKGLGSTFSFSLPVQPDVYIEQMAETGGKS